jgi:pullulanase-type alpha-1,6-glucosidase
MLTGEVSGAWAQWLDRNTLVWAISPTRFSDPRESGSADSRSYLLVCLTPTGRWEVGLRHRPQGLAAEHRSRNPHLCQDWAFDVDQIAVKIDGSAGVFDRDAIAVALRGRVVAVAHDATGRVLEATGVQIPGILDDLYPQAVSAQLGVNFQEGRPVVAVWAPTALTVALELRAQLRADPPPEIVPMVRQDATGVWRVLGEPFWRERYYRFVVTRCHPATGAVTTVTVTDPYSVSLSANSEYSQLVDLADPALAPAGWRSVGMARAAGRGAGRRSPQVHELSIRDFSIADRTIPPEHRGGYLAFTHTSSPRMRHLRELSAAGLTHVQLMPVFDFAAIPDRRADQASVSCDLGAFPPDSQSQQECVMAVARRDGYDWGYDPLHFTVPEGSYATEPDGPARVRELRQLVAALDSIGLGVVLDVAYNHTAAADLDPRAVLDQIVPGYYHRLHADGSMATSTGGANTAPEHAMMGKLVVDSVVTWARQYKVAGFRFDFMGYHPKANLLAVRAALDQLSLADDGVDGPAMVLWGEGWNAGEVANDARFPQATQANLAGTGIATFNDRLRDAVRGGGPADPDPRAQGFASGLVVDPSGDEVNGPADQQLERLRNYHDLIQVGLTGNLAEYHFVGSHGNEVTGHEVPYNGSPAGYTAQPLEAVAYVDAHDNEILYDALAYKLPAGTPLSERVRAQILALAFPTLSQGVGFVVAGSDQLRSKSLDGNSYRSGDWFNAILDPSEGNGFGRGLPPRPDNGARWQYAQPLLVRADLVPDASVIVDAGHRYAELLAVRSGSPLFSLPDASAVQRRLSFPLSGPSATPGVITMLLDDRFDPPIDPRYQAILVVFNAVPSEVRQTVASLARTGLVRHPVLAKSVDPVVRSARVDPATGTVTVPGRTVAVFVAPRISAGR